MCHGGVSCKRNIFFSLFASSMVQLVPIRYSSFKPETNFERLIQDSAYDDALFLFCDNFANRDGFEPGANSARIRPLRGARRPRPLGL